MQTGKTVLMQNTALVGVCPHSQYLRNGFIARWNPFDASLGVMGKAAPSVSVDTWATCSTSTLHHTVRAFKDMITLSHWGSLRILSKRSSKINHTQLLVMESFFSCEFNQFVLDDWVKEMKTAFKLMNCADVPRQSHKDIKPDTNNHSVKPLTVSICHSIPTFISPWAALYIFCTYRWICKQFVWTTLLWSYHYYSVCWGLLTVKTEKRDRLKMSYSCWWRHLIQMI